jgi:hypothetical protein
MQTRLKHAAVLRGQANYVQARPGVWSRLTCFIQAYALGYLVHVEILPDDKVS